jgi:hypothetical protein
MPQGQRRRLTREMGMSSMRRQTGCDVNPSWICAEGRYSFLDEGYMETNGEDGQSISQLCCLCIVREGTPFLEKGELFKAIDHCGGGRLGVAGRSTCVFLERFD